MLHAINPLLGPGQQKADLREKGQKKKIKIPNRLKQSFIYWSFYFGAVRLFTSVQMWSPLPLSLKWSWWFYLISPNVNIKLIFFHRITGTHRPLLRKIIEVNRHCEYSALGFPSYLIALFFRYTRTTSLVFYSQAGLPAYLWRVNLQLYWQVFSHENSNVQLFIFKLYAHPTREPKDSYYLPDQM